MVLRWFNSSGEAQLAELLASPVRARPALQPRGAAPRSPCRGPGPLLTGHADQAQQRPAQQRLRQPGQGHVPPSVVCVPVWEGKVALTGQTSSCWAGARLAISEQTCTQASALGCGNASASARPSLGPL